MSPNFYAKAKYFKVTGPAVLQSLTTQDKCAFRLSGSRVIVKLGQIIVFLLLPIAIPKTESFPQKNRYGKLSGPGVAIKENEKKMEQFCPDNCSELLKHLTQN